MELVVGDSFMEARSKITLRKGGSTMKKLFTVIAASMLLMAGNLYARQQKSDVSFGTNATGIELKSGVLNPITNGGVSLGSSALQFNALYLSGTATCGDISITDDLTIGDKLTVTGLANLGVSYETLISSVTSNQITPNSSFIVLQSTATNEVVVDLVAGAVISTTTATTGDYIILTSTQSFGFRFPSGTTHCLVNVSSPVVVGQYDTITAVFNGSYWVVVSSSGY